MGLLEFMVHCAVTWAQFFMSAATLTLCTLVFSSGTIQPFCNSICGKTSSCFHIKKYKVCIIFVAYTVSNW